MAWMGAMISEDEDRDFQQKLELADYAASYVNPKAVEHVRRVRKKSRHVSDDDFAKSIERLSGRTAPKVQW